MKQTSAWTAIRKELVTLDTATLVRLSASRVRIELVERLFPDGLNHPPRLSESRDQSDTLNALALAYQFSGGSPVRGICRWMRSAGGQVRRVAVCRRTGCSP
jgi:hypothetical protein